MFDKKDNTTKDQQSAVAVKPAKDDKVAMKDLYEESGKKGKSVAVKDDKKIIFSQSYRALVRPIITEKSAALNTLNKYTFEVDIDVNKITIAKAIESVYGVKPARVNIIRQSGKTVSRGRIKGKRKNWKKAVITLPKGKSIKVYEGV